MDWVTYRWWTRRRFLPRYSGRIKWKCSSENCKWQSWLNKASSSDLTRDETRILQDRRVVRLAINLAAILDGYAAVRPPVTTDDKTNENEKEEKLREKAALEKFEAQMKPIAQSLANAAHGPKMLKQIGFVYEKQAEQVLTDPVAGFGTWADLEFVQTLLPWSKIQTERRTQFSAMKAAFDAFGTVKKIAEEEEGYMKEDKEEEEGESEKNAGEGDGGSADNTTKKQEKETKKKPPLTEAEIMQRRRASKRRHATHFRNALERFGARH